VDNLNNNNTIIENVEYLDMSDLKNSWYFDAERFDVNFPLVRSYNGADSQLFKETFSEWYDYWNAVFSYYRNIPDMSGICYVVDTLDMVDEVDELCYVPLTSRIDEHLEYEFLFQTKQVLPNGKKITYFLIGLEHLGSIVNLNEKFYLKDGHYIGGFSRPPLYPHTQLIISRDWDLLKRYFFFMIRNHQYKGSNFIYIVDNEDGPDARRHRFADLSDTPFTCLPKDYRFDYSRFGKDEDAVEWMNGRVLIMNRTGYLRKKRHS